jgi:ribosomal protein L22
MKGMPYKSYGIYFFIFLLLVGCGGQKAKLAQIQTTAPKTFHADLSNFLGASAKKVAGVDDAVAVVMDKEASVALKVTGFERFRLKPIKKEVSTRLKGYVSKDFKLRVTTDKKIYKELQRLKQDAEKKNKPPIELTKQFKKIQKDLRG